MPVNSKYYLGVTQMMKKIALVLILMSWASMSLAYTSYTTGTGSSSDPFQWNSSTPPGDLYLVTKNNDTYTYKGCGSGCGCSYGGCTVPEPETFFLMGIGLLGVYLARRYK